MGVLVIRVLLFGVSVRAPDFWRLHNKYEYMYMYLYMCIYIYIRILILILTPKKEPLMFGDPDLVVSEFFGGVPFCWGPDRRDPSILGCC